MIAASYIIAASQLFAIAFGAPLLHSNSRSARSLVERTAYTVFGGNGSPSEGWPAESDWKSFEDLWKANEGMMSSSCSQFSQENDQPGEIADIKSAIQSVSKESGLKPEFILAIMMQESKGCVRAPTTNYGYNNPGLMQSFQGKNSCNPSGSGTVPCPSDTITGMISEGAGIGLEFGLQQAIAQSGASDVSKYYKGARIYNSGSVAASGNLGEGVATHCYASDIANRLIGWADDTTGCDEGTIASVQGKASSGGNANNDQDASTPTSAPASQPTSQPKDEPANNTPPASIPSGSDSSPNGPKAEGAAADCKQWHTVKKGDTCDSTGVSMAKLMELNTSLKSDCSNLWAGSAYCVAA